jgi:SAM-dependent methyltransferase
MRFLEIGCAPGKTLAWVAKTVGAEVAGIDYSANGIYNARRLFEHLGIHGDLRWEDVFETTFKEGSFDCVFSCGLIEHFDDPRKIVEIHARLVKPGGKAVIAVPNYGGIYGKLQRLADPCNLAVHNLDIMNLSRLAGLAPAELATQIRGYAFGRITLGLVSLERVMHRWAAAGLRVFVDLIGLLQPFEKESLCPLLVLEIVRKAESEIDGNSIFI